MPKLDYDYFYSQIKDSSIDLVEDGQVTKTYRMRKYPNSSMMSCWLFFTPAGIIITGDMRPADHGVIAQGYSLEWFTGKLEPSYLAEKFIQEKWVPESAIESWQECLQAWKETFEKYRKEAQEEFGTDPWPDPDESLLCPMDWRSGYDRQELEGVTIIQAIGHLLDDHSNFQTAQTLYEALPAYHDKSDGYWMCPFSSEDLGGHDYVPAEIGWLYAIQRRFAECYQMANKEINHANQT